MRLVKQKSCVDAWLMACVFLVLTVGWTSKVLLSSPTSADDVVDVVNLTLAVSCSVSETVDTAHTTTLNNDQYKTNIGTTTFNVFCNDKDGYSIYAIGYSGDTYGNTEMLYMGNQTPAPSNIVTGTATSGSTSNWAMKLTAVAGTYQATLTNGFGSYRAVPTTYTKAATLSFHYAVQLGDGEDSSAKVNETAISGENDFSKTLAAGETVTIELASGGGSSSVTKIEITDILLVEEKTVNLTFKPASNGSYTVDGTAITANTSKEGELSSKVYALAATPATGQQFFGWYNETAQKYFSVNQTIEAISFTEDAVIYPVFISASDGIFVIGTTPYRDLQSAVKDAKNGNTIIMTENATFSGNCTIPAGVTLLIPFNDTYTSYTTSVGIMELEKPEDYETPYAHKILTMAEGSSITVNGSISVPSKVSVCGQNTNSYNGTPIGPHGRIQMGKDSSIILNNGASLYAYGYVAGSGTVTAKNGSKVYECFQIRSWRGGTATLGSVGDLSSAIVGNTVKPLKDYLDYKVFPINQYYVQNVEVSLTLEKGAQEYIWAAAGALSQTLGTMGDFMGEGGMFQLGNGTSITKRYDSERDRLVFDIYGDVSLSAFAVNFEASIPILGTKNIVIDTAEYVMPITNNVTVNIHDKSSVVIDQDVALTPGTEVNVLAGGNITIASNKNIYIYDNDDWGAYAGQLGAGTRMIPVAYSTAANGAPTIRTNDNLVDAKVDVNGTVTVNGAVYTTKSGAEVISSEGTGEILYISAAPENGTTYQATQDNTTMNFIAIDVTAARLQNENGTYFETADNSANTTFTYGHKTCEHQTGEEDTVKDGKWAVGTHSHTAEVTNPTCTKGGYTTYTCACGHSYTDNVVAALGHTEVSDAAVDATCTEPGLTAGSHCETCGEPIVAQETVAALGHTPGAAATCTTAQTCTVCGETVVPATGLHNNAAGSNCIHGASIDNIGYDTLD